MVEFLGAGMVFCADFNWEFRPFFYMGHTADEEFVVVNGASRAVIAEVEVIGNFCATGDQAFAQGTGFKF